MQSVINKIERLIQEAEEKKEDWRKGVKRDPEKFHTPPGTFQTGTPDSIAKIVSQDWKAEYKTVMSRLNFYLNRGGRNISPKIRGNVEKAKEIVKKKYDKKDK